MACWLILLFVLCLFCIHPGLAETNMPHGPLRIGIFPFSPINFTDEAGQAQGFYPALLEEISRKEGWELNYVSGSLAEGLEGLQNHEIDLMMSVAYSNERAKIMDYTHESVLELWGQVFVNKDKIGLNVSDLAGHHIGVVQKGIIGKNFIKMAQEAKISFVVHEYPHFDDVFNAVKNGDVTAGVAPQIFGLRHGDEYNLIPSSIQIPPISIHFAAKKGQHHNFLSTIDAYLYRWKQDEASYYYQQHLHWLGREPMAEQVPVWFFPAVIVVAGISLLMFIHGLLCTAQVKKSTVRLASANQELKNRSLELQGKNRELQNEIEHRLQIEKALQESEHRYQLLVEEGFDGIFIHQNFKIIYVNPQILQMTGYTAEEMLGADTLTFVAPESLEQLKAYPDGKAEGVVEFNLKKKNASSLQIEAFFADCTFHGEQARIGALRDISIRKQAEAELRGSEQKYANLFYQFKSLLNAISDPLALLTPGMKTVWTNEAYDQICSELRCGCESGMTFFDLNLNERESPILSCLKAGRVYEDTMITPDQRSWEVKAFPLKDKAQRTNQVIAIAVDVTEKIRLREQASRASRLASLGELAAGIAHEINNPNAVILLNMPIIRDVFADADALFSEYCREHGELSLAGIEYGDLSRELPLLIERTLESAARIKRIVEDLKNFVRDGGPKEFDRIDLNQVVETGVRLLENCIKKSTSHFRTTFGTCLPAGRGDFQKLEQVVVNLIQNACQALTDSKQEVLVETAYDRDANELILRVHDQGQGIAQEQLDRVADPFYTTKRSSGGTGLGLSVTARILQEHQARMFIESEPGTGSVFSVFIPVWEGGD